MILSLLNYGMGHTHLLLCGETHKAENVTFLRTKLGRGENKATLRVVSNKSFHSGNRNLFLILLPFNFQLKHQGNFQFL